MAGIVLDAPVAISWLLGDEVASPQAARIVDEAMLHGAIAPAVWPVEVLNGLLMALRRQRLSADRLGSLMAQFVRLATAMDVDGTPDEAVLRRCFALAQSNALTAYDATFLELALRHALPLATYDARLRRAAEAERVALSD